MILQNSVFTFCRYLLFPPPPVPLVPMFVHCTVYALLFIHICKCTLCIVVQWMMHGSENILLNLFDVWITNKHLNDIFSTKDCYSNHLRYVYHFIDYYYCYHDGVYGFVSNLGKNIRIRMNLNGFEWMLKSYEICTTFRCSFDLNNIIHIFILLLLFLYMLVWVFGVRVLQSIAPKYYQI